MQTEKKDGQISLFGQDMEFGKMSPEPSPVRKVKTSKSSYNRSSRLKNHTFMLLDLRPGAGNMLGPCWEYDPAWLGSLGTLNTSECPSDVVESSLSQILLDTVPSKYYLSPTACLGILRRAEQRGKALPETLEAALKLQAGVSGCREPAEEAREPCMLAAGFSAGAGASAGSIGYGEETAPTLKGSASGNCMPTVLCLNDQGGNVMDISTDKTGTLRAQAHGHEPLVFDAHAQDTRYRGPVGCSPALSASFFNHPLVFKPSKKENLEETYCITGNAIDREPQNGGNGIGFQPDLSYTLTATDHHAVFRRQRVDLFCDDTVVGTQSARQYKDATDLVCQPGHDAPAALLIRRLTPQECEALQGFPPGWADLPGASDSARYKALGNSVAIPWVEYIMAGIARAAEGD